MPTLITEPMVITAAGSTPKVIEEYIGRVRSGSAEVSIAHMKSAPGWVEPGQTPEFDEYTLVLAGELRVATRDQTYIVRSGQAILVERNTWVQYSTPAGADYIAVCLPAFSPDTVHRDA